MGVPVDTVAARRRYQRSAELGDSTGESQLGWMYAHVEPIDCQLAMKWYRKAADQHDQTAENNIGYLYENGLGVPQDFGQAASWNQMATTTGYAREQFHLGNLYDPQNCVSKISRGDAPVLDTGRLGFRLELHRRSRWGNTESQGLQPFIYLKHRPHELYASLSTDAAEAH